MTRAAKKLRGIALGILFLTAVVLLWPFAVAGALAFILSGLKFNRWVALGMAAVTVLMGRMVTGEWILRFGEASSPQGFAGIWIGVVNLALADVCVSSFARCPARFFGPAADVPNRSRSDFATGDAFGPALDSTKITPRS